MSKKPAKVEDDQTTMKIPNLYKKKSELNGVVPHKLIRDKVDQAIENGKLQTLQIWGQIGPISIRAFMECLCDLNYGHLKKIRIWKADLQDEGLRAICNYIQKCNSVEYLDLMENNITQLGCEFLAKVLMNSNNKIVKLRLDNNKIGQQGIKILSEGLRSNDTIQKISLNYCNIDEEGSKYIQQILANLNSNLRTLKLQGNPFKNQGFYEVLRGVLSCGQHLQKLNLADTGLNILGFRLDDIQLTDSLEQKISTSLIELIRTHKQIAKYNFRNNYIPDCVVMKMLNEVKENKSIFMIQLPECIAHELKELYVEIIKKRKPKKKKGKKGKGKGKGKAKK